MTVPFNVGYVNAFQLAEWDGTNESDVVNWLNTGYSDPSKQVSITSVTASELTLNAPGNSPTTVVVPLNGWVGPGAPGALKSLSGAQVWVADKAQFWLSDQYGRPSLASDIESP